MAVSLPYELGDHIRIHLAQYYPAISDSVIGGDVGDPLEAGDVVKALKAVTLDPVENPETNQYIKLYVVNISDQVLREVAVYLSPNIGIWSVAVENTKNKTDTTYTGGDVFPTDVLTPDGFQLCQSLDSALPVAETLEPGDKIAVWVNGVVKYEDLFRNPGVKPSCAVIVVYAAVAETQGG